MGCRRSRQPAENQLRSQRWGKVRTRIGGPAFLPDDEHFLYLAHGPGVNELRVGSLTSTDTWSLGPFESNAVYAQGHLLFVRGGKFMAQSFDTATRQLAGDPVVLADQTAALDEGQRGLFSVSETGVLGYSAGGDRPRN